eukprot:TRINITY_DN29276_c0_g1_i1.p1 TRINITY_DN29276_c0_g1~~TRINITY_DN29276_c0_g1_i1.p1  ORF type:complete len:2179 (-),score=352.79 TRINITY_DN29276_c0_g1_i1:25-5709(-)
MLFGAANLGFLAAVETLLEFGAARDPAEDCGAEPVDVKAVAARNLCLSLALMEACKGGHAEVVDRLIDAGAEVEPSGNLLLTTMKALCTDKEFLSPKHSSVPYESKVALFPTICYDWPRRTAIVRRLCACRADPNVGGNVADHHPLIWAARAGSLDAVKVLCQNGAVCASAGLEEPLQRSAASLSCELVKLLLSSRANPDAEGGHFDGQATKVLTPLATVCSAKVQKTAESVQDRSSREAEWAIRAEIAECLVRARADVERSTVELSEDKSMDSPPLAPLEAAAASGNRGIVKLLMENKASAAASNSSAVLECVKRAQRFPCEWKEDERERDYTEPRPPPYFNRVQRENWSVAQWRLYRNERTKRREDRSKRLKLERASFEADTSARIQILRELFAAGASPNVNGGLVEAARTGNSMIVDVLLNHGARMCPLLRWCPSCKRALLIADGAASSKKRTIRCDCGNIFPEAPSPLHSLVSCLNDTALRGQIIYEDADSIAALWSYVAETMLVCGGQTRPQWAPAWGGSDCSSLVSTLVKQRAIVDARLPTGGTFLRAACLTGHVEMVEALLELRADPNADQALWRGLDHAEYGITPLEAALKGDWGREGVGGGPSDLVVGVASACGGDLHLPEDIERTVVCSADAAVAADEVVWDSLTGVNRGTTAKPGSPRGRPGSPRDRTAKRNSVPTPTARTAPPRRSNSPRVLSTQAAAGQVTFALLDVKDDGPGSTAGMLPGQLLVGAKGHSDAVELRGQDFATVARRGSVKLHEMLASPVSLTFRSQPCVYTYERPVTQALVLEESEHCHLRVTGLLVVPDRDSEPSGDAGSERCKAVSKRIIASVEGEDVTNMRSDDVRKLISKKGLTIGFASPVQEASAVRSVRESRRALIVNRLCQARAEVNMAAGGSTAEAPIVVASRVGNAEAVSVLAQNGATQMLQALCAACEVGNATVVDLLLNRRAAVDFADAHDVNTGEAARPNCTPILLAARGLMSSKPTSEPQEMDAPSISAEAPEPLAASEYPPLPVFSWIGWKKGPREAVERAARQKEEAVRVAICDRLVLRRVDPNMVDSEGCSALHWAASAGLEGTVRFLIKIGASVMPSVSKPITTPLHGVCAAMPNDSDRLIELLIENNAVVDACDAEGYTPLITLVRNMTPPNGGAFLSLPAETERRLDCMKLLLGRGAKISRSLPETVLHVAVRLAASATPPPPAEASSAWVVYHQLLELRAELDSSNASGRTPLRLAVELGEGAFTAMLLDNQDAALELNLVLRAAVDVACATHTNNSVVWKLLEKRADPNYRVAGATLEDYQPPLVTAAAAAQAEIFSALLKAGAIPNAVNANGEAALHVLGTGGLGSSEARGNRRADDGQRAAMAMELLTYPIDVNAPVLGPSQHTALVCAVRSGRVQLLRTLVSRHADMNVGLSDTAGASILHVAAALSREVSPTDTQRELVNELINCLARVEALDDHGRSPLHIAVAAGREDTVLTLMSKDVDVGRQDKEGRTALHAIAESSMDEAECDAMMRLLVDVRVWNVDGKRDRRGRTALHAAAQRKHLAYVKALLKRKANPTSIDKTQATPLHFAVESICHDVAKVAPSEDIAEQVASVQAALSKACETSSVVSGDSDAETTAGKGHRAGRPCVCILGGTEAVGAATQEVLRVLSGTLHAALHERVWLLTAGEPGVQETFALNCGCRVCVVSLTPPGEVGNSALGRKFCCGTDASTRDKIMALLGNVYIIAEGGPSVAQQAQTAFTLGANIVPLACTGGASAGKFGFPQSALIRPPSVEEETWSHLATADCSADAVGGAAASAVLSLLEAPPALSTTEEIIAALLDANADADARDEHDQTPLVRALRMAVAAVQGVDASTVITAPRIDRIRKVLTESVAASAEAKVLAAIL